MCGIAGVLNLSPDARLDAEALRRMAGQLVHRGPDAEGYYEDPQGRCGLAFRRLAVIDLQTGNQPVANEDGTVWVVLNGEIYNYRALRDELIARGHQLRSHSDTEVIVHLYEELGEECFQRLAGMFAIAIWDQTRARLVLARDRVGKKPLCYARLGGQLAFASELKAILAIRTAGAPRIDVQSLHRYLLFQYTPAPNSIYRDVRKVPPGSVVSFSAGDSADPTPRSFWRPPTPAEFSGTYEEALARLSELLTRAVEKRLIADVPLGAFLSGGLDSSIVVALMRRLGVSPLRTFSVGFADPRYDESSHARRVARHFQTEHHEQIVRPQAREVLDTLVFHYDEPFADSSAIPTYYVARHTRAHVTVALTGDGGDESFAGYDRYRALRLLARCDRFPAALRSAMTRAAEFVPHARAKSFGNRLHRLLTPLALPPARRYLSWVSVFSPDQLLAGYRPQFREQLDFEEPLRWFDETFAAAGDGGAHSAVLADFRGYLPYDLLTKVDIASMACSLECRSPFLDHELIEFALSLPLRWRMRKRILRDFAAPLLPAEVLTRPKMGFGVPVGEWFRRELRELLVQNVLGPASLSRRLFNADWLERLAQDHLAARANHEHRLWALFMLERWAQRWNPHLE
ncbi:MAG: asparagine synthase (glutamine-hydrolyzing) [Phycisphaerae bacterium]